MTNFYMIYVNDGNDRDGVDVTSVLNNELGDIIKQEFTRMTDHRKKVYFLRVPSHYCIRLSLTSCKPQVKTCLEG